MVHCYREELDHISTRSHMRTWYRYACLISINLEPIRFHPALHVLDAHFKSVSSCGCFLRATPKVQLSVISIRMVLDIVC